MKTAWLKEHLMDGASNLPFSFTYGGQSSAMLLAGWPAKVADERLDAQRTRRTIQWTDPKTGLEVRCVAVDYADFPAVEWTVWIKNTGAKDTPILADIQGLDTVLDRPESRDLILHYVEGDSTNPGYAPRQKNLGPGTQLRFSPENGRPTSGSFPYYNIEGDHGGVIVVVGWSGQWACSLTADPQGSLHVKAGQELTHLKLRPGEEVRSPLIVMMFWQGSDWLEGQNLWRRWMRAHNMPQPGGKEVPLLRAAGTSGLGPDYAYDLVNEKDQIAAMDRYFEEGIRLNYWWLDIYHGSTNAWCTDVAPYAVNGAFLQSKGLLLALDWNADPSRYPNGLRAVSDHARSKGAKLIAWYEPEHVWPGYKLYEHQDWLLSVPDDPRIKAQFNQGLPLGERRLLNLGHPSACQWAIDHFSHLVVKEGIAVYRQDFNLEPLVFWRHSDPPDRQGMTENLYVRGYLRFWQTLLERCPDLLIDSCASGGRRNDLETLRLSVPLWRSDTAAPALALQCQTYGLALWIPYFGTGTPPGETAYQYRSSLGASLVSGYDVRKRDLDYDLLRKLEGDFWRTAPLFLEDYYPLTPYSQDKDQWMAWQFNRPAQGDGVVQAFRREYCTDTAKTFLLHGLDPQARYAVTNTDCPGTAILSGRELMDKGLTVEIPRHMKQLPPEGRVDVSLPAECVAFGPFSRADEVPPAELLRCMPTELAAGGTRVGGSTFPMQNGRLDLGRMLTTREQVAWVYIPFSVATDGQAELGFGADWWYQAYLDGVVISDTLSGNEGNKIYPPTCADHIVQVDLRRGDHLLAIRFARGGGSGVLAAGGPRELDHERAAVPGAAVIVYQRVK